MSKPGLVRAALLVLALAWAGSAEAQDWRVARMSGGVYVEANAFDLVSLSNGLAIAGGSRIVADRSGRALLVRGNDSIVVSPGTLVALPGDSGDPFTRILQEKGTAEFDIDHQSRPHFAVETPYLAAVVKGTHFTVRVFRGGAEVSVLRGRVEVDDLLTGEKVDVLTGQKAVAQAGRRLAVSGLGVLAPVVQGPRPRRSLPASELRAALAPGKLGLVGRNVTAAGVTANVGGVASVNAGAGGASVSAAGGTVSASVSNGGVSANVGGISAGVSLH